MLAMERNIFQELLGTTAVEEHSSLFIHTEREKSLLVHKRKQYNVSREYTI